MLLRNPILRLLVMNAGLLIWGLQFTLVYMVASIVCAKSDAAPVLGGFDAASLGVLATTALCFAATGLVLVLSLRPSGADASPTDRFIRQVTALIAGISLFAILWTGLPALVVPSCG
ncbi:hypothetical protein [Microvirga pudoricolor]|uniref:hypothetical protein n=1 Tax=Microvirga pudoricolor TaxID=2778729 RepID=UPI00195288FB|nr:hypothetical protein [Microvirga pudoricolor]MBM6594948.1 hypothetical protein [Microvirga pudoricolor]